MLSCLGNLLMPLRLTYIIVNGQIFNKYLVTFLKKFWYFLRPIHTDCVKRSRIGQFLHMRKS